MQTEKNVALEPEVLEQADRLARAENKTVDELANEAVKRYALDKLVRYGNGGAFLGRWESSWSDTRGIAFMSRTMWRVSVIWMWPERRWNRTQWNDSIQLPIRPRIHTLLPVTGKVWAKWSLFWPLPMSIRIVTC